MSARGMMLEIIRLGMDRLGQERGWDDASWMPRALLGKDELDECGDTELFALIRALHAYGALEDVRAVTNRDAKVVMMGMVTVAQILDIDERQRRGLDSLVSCASDQHGLKLATDRGWLDAWLRILRLWDASRFPGVDNLAPYQARYVK